MARNSPVAGPGPQQANRRPRARLTGDTVVYVSAAPAPWLREGLAPLQSACSVIIDDRPEVLQAIIGQVEVMFAWPNARALLEPVWNEATRLRWIHHSGAGMDHLLFPALQESAVICTNSRRLYSDAVAEHAIALLFALAKRLPHVIEDQRERRWIHRESETLVGRTLGVIGLGSIGQAVARRAHALGMQVIGTKRRIAATPHGIEQVYPPEATGEMLARCDFVVVSIPHTAETTALIGAAELHAMKPTAFLINVARGAVIDEIALREALREGRIAGAASDVFTDEPLPPTSPWYDTPRFLISPHMAPNAAGWQQRAVGLFVDNLERWRQGRRLRNVVDKGRGY